VAACQAPNRKGSGSFYPQNAATLSDGFPLNWSIMPARSPASRRPFVGGNWKMNTDLASAVELAEDVAVGCAPYIEQCDVAVFPPFVYLQAVGKALGNHGVALGAQDVAAQPNGAFTGEISAEMLLDLNVRHVLVGHSERRHVIGEDNDLVNAKARAALNADLSIVLCVGETIDQRQAGQTDAVTTGQLRAGLFGVPAEQMARVTIAYEPVWAIGTGRTASPADAEAAHVAIRATLGAMYDDDLAAQVRIQYGGSATAETVKDLILQPNIDGGLVGGGSLKAAVFTQVVALAAERLRRPRPAPGKDRS
jgi:triosephosphate isomerase